MKKSSLKTNQWTSPESQFWVLGVEACVLSFNRNLGQLEAG
jgi:hypothetical protein